MTALESVTTNARTAESTARGGRFLETMRARSALVLSLAAFVPVVVVVATACGSPASKVLSGAPVLQGDDASADASFSARSCTPWTEHAEPLDPSTPATPTDPNDPNDPFYVPQTRRPTPTDEKDLCEVADSNLTRSEKGIVAAAGAGGPMARHGAWDHVTKPVRLDLLDRRYALTTREHALLGQNGFVVMERRAYSTYAWALHDVYQSQLPIYVSADAILHAVFASNDHLLASIEAAQLVPLLGRSLSAMHCALAEAATSYPPEVARDLDLYLTVARSLLADAPVPSVLGTDAEASARIADAKKASGIATVSMFGRDRRIDWSQYEPRGHYANAAPAEDAADGAASDAATGSFSLSPYFRAAMWLSRIEMNLVSRSSRSSSPTPLPDPRETPREAIDALALADLVERAHAADDVARLDRAWTLLAGRREDVTVADLSKLRSKARVTKIDLGAFDALKGAIGNDFQRTARLHPMPEGSTVLPAITTLLGPRVVADAAAFRPLVNGEVPERYLVGPGDVAYVLGLDRGKTYLAADLVKFPALAQKLDVARGIVTSAPDAGDLYGAWLGALRGVSVPVASLGVVPSFMKTPAYDDLRLNTLIAGYGQIRHNYVLMAGQSYDEGGCRIPDGWVEPLPGVYEGIARYASRGAATLKELDPKDAMGGVGYFAQLETVANVLSVIAKHEVEGRALTEDEKRFLGMVVEMTPGGTGGPPTYTGWYFDIFRGRADEALATASFVADYHTSSYLDKVVYAGATGPRMGVFVVDAGGAPRVMVGPVARAYELTGTTAKRFNDATADASVDKHDPWAKTYTAEPPPVPGLSVAAFIPSEKRVVKMVLRAKTALPRVVIELTDHHGVPMSTTTRAVPAHGRVVVSLTPPRHAEGVRVRVGEYMIEGATGGPGESVSLEAGGVTVDSGDWGEISK
ncbi:MAG: hypothetical protein QOI41_3519 [Myxococcales bacterium]|nr:hypothetical protein [Myxococcales bacterium]